MSQMLITQRCQKKGEKKKQNCIDPLPLHQVERSFCLEQMDT